ncbi:uncharacterized protein [Malus domestica]|uniref:uncharacterized protein isoform X2 n=1 Tax=Malus domestica TaxID=3750 RepID=UPI0039762CC5
MLFVFWGFCLHLSKPFMLKVENVKALLEVETRVLLQQQKVLCEGREMRNSEMLSALGVKDEDWIMIVSNVTLRSVDCGSLVGRVPKLILQIKGFTDATNRKRLKIDTPRPEGGHAGRHVSVTQPFTQFGSFKNTITKMKHPRVSPTFVNSVRTPLDSSWPPKLCYLEPGGAQNKIEWVSKTKVFRKYFI